MDKETIKIYELGTDQNLLQVLFVLSTEISNIYLECLRL